MGLANDLVAVVAIYATEYCTYELFGFSRDLARSLYTRSALWRAKSEFEARGLMVKDEVVAGRWRNYYRLVNRTYYGEGRLLRLTRLGDQIVTETLLSIAPVIFIHTLRDDYLIQLSDNSLSISGRVLPYPRPIRRVVIDYPVSYVVVVDERGMVGRADLASFDTVGWSWGSAPVGGVVDIDWIDFGWYGLLGRDGGVTDDDGVVWRFYDLQTRRNIRLVRLETSWGPVVLGDDGVPYLIDLWESLAREAGLNQVDAGGWVIIPTNLDLVTYTASDSGVVFGGVKGLFNGKVTIRPHTKEYRTNYAVIGLRRDLRIESYDSRDKHQASITLPLPPVQSLSASTNLTVIVDFGSQ